VIKRLTTTAVTTALMLLPRLASACAVCGGDPEAPMQKGMSMGILSLLIITGGMLVSFAGFFVFLRVRARMRTHEPSIRRHEEALA
jgi:hypothetical protein